jgi:hypothetical protein
MAGPDDNLPTLNLGDFNFGFVPNVSAALAAPPAPPQPPPLGVLQLLVGKTFKGPGYNCIFRPRSNTPLQNRAVPGVSQDNDLQLSLTVENIVFSDKVLGEVPNRGLLTQPDVLLAGISYVDSVSDVTNENSGLGDGPGTDIHFEPGLWMNVPPSPKSGIPKGTLCRMACIPHGTTINAQGVQPSLTPTNGAPTFDTISIQPFNTDPKSTQKVPKFNNQTLSNKNNRNPQNLDIFNSK